MTTCVIVVSSISNSSSLNTLQKNLSKPEARYTNEQTNRWMDEQRRKPSQDGVPLLYCRQGLCVQVQTIQSFSVFT